MFLLLGLAALLGCTGATDDSGAGDGAKSVPVVTSGPRTGDLFLRGRLVDGSRPIPKARVWISLDPEDLDDLKQGDRVPQWKTDPVTTTADGRYAIRIDPLELPSKYLGVDSHFLNFELMFVAEKQLGIWGSTLWLLKDPRVWRSEGASHGDAVVSLTYDLGRSRLTTTDSTGEVTRDKFSLMPAPKGLLP